MSDYSGLMPSQIKIELRRCGARDNGQTADSRQSGGTHDSKCNRRCVATTDFFAHQRVNP